jgi:hypothetical protein
MAGAGPESRRAAGACLAAAGAAVVLAPAAPAPAAGATVRQAVLEWSTDGAAWTRGAALAIPNTPLQWDAGLDAEVVLPQPAAAVWVRVTSDTGAIALECAGHLEEPPSPGELRITHRWREGTDARAFDAPRGCAVYEVPCGRDPRGHTIEMRVPSVPRDAAPQAAREPAGDQR